ncbi:hypothetical protein QPB21_004022 [Vibrio alginolyticus]|uniref:hypothetical protein n=1 Tax=Vibrio TaxID=662 RepID=UPI00215C0E2F|nr:MULTISPECIES: hypothetical protein [Vibrio]EII5415912.1 hypothetical protein [Vibrio alginolyticus]EIO9265073.1 hypothetical protein [Vibrio alginolyticus]EJL6725783.1 hypothetical protein [Vibrio alginolyticus]EJN3802294.1 hypothetical protein [Vibrio alginolyticus]EJX2556837.1 hypothetical protein [Vibrio alginolyticus]
MKKVTCSKVQTLSEEDLNQVVGGFDPRNPNDYTNAINEIVGSALGGGQYGGSGTNAANIKKGNDMGQSTPIQTGGCNTRASGRGRGSSSSSSSGSGLNVIRVFAAKAS